MDNKFKTSKYAAIILASTMALSTVASVTPQAFGEKGITAHAEEATASDVSSKIGEISIDDLATADTTTPSISKYEAAVNAASETYNGLSSAEKAKVSAADLKKLNAHKAIVKDAAQLSAIKDLPKEEDLSSVTGDVDAYEKYSTDETTSLPHVKDVVVKGKTETVGRNEDLDAEVDKLKAFKAAYDKIIASNKDTKSILASKYKEYTALLKIATAKQKLVEGSYNAKDFTDLYNIIQNGNVSADELNIETKGYAIKEGKALKISKKGEFTVDGDKYTAVYENGTIKVTDAKGKDQDILEGKLTILNQDEDAIVIKPESNDTIRVNGKKYTIGGTAAATATFTDEEGKTLPAIDSKVTIDDKEYTVSAFSKDAVVANEETDTEAQDAITSYQLTLAASTAATLDDIYTVEYKSGIIIKKAEELVRIKATTSPTVAIPLRNLNKSMSISEYKKLKAGSATGKYSDKELEIINALDAAYKALSKDGKKSVSAEQLTNYKAYVADVKAQTSLEKKLTSTDAKGVTNQINKLKYNADLKVYENNIKNVRSAYDALSDKYKKKIKPAVLAKLTGQEQAIKVMKKINNIPVAELLEAEDANAIKGFQAKVDKVAKTVKGSKNGGTGDYYNTDKLAVKARSYVKNFKDIAAINKVITAQAAYLKQKATVDKFEDALDDVTTNKTLRIVNNYVKLGSNAYKITTDKASKAITLTPADATTKLASHTINSGAPVKLTTDDLAAKEYTGTTTITADNKTYDVTYEGNSVSLKESGSTSATAIVPVNGEINLGTSTSSKMYKVTVADKTLTLTEKVENEVNEGTKSVVANEAAEVKLDGITYTAKIADSTTAVKGFYAGNTTTAKTLAVGDKIVKSGKTYVYKEPVAAGEGVTGSDAGFYDGANVYTPVADDKIVQYDKTYTYKDAEKVITLTPKSDQSVTAPTSIKIGKGQTVGDKNYTVTVKDNTVTLVDEFDPNSEDGFIVTNTKGKVSIAEHTVPTEADDLAKVADVIDFKGVSVATFVDPTSSKYTTEQLAAIQEASKQYAAVGTNKEAKKYINKEDTTALKAYEKALKNQLALEKKALDNYNKTLKFATDLTEKADGTTISQYEVDANAAQTALTNFTGRYNTEKAKAESSYKTKFANHVAASAVATDIALLPTAAELTVDTYKTNTVGNTETKEETITATKAAYTALNADQKKLLASGLEILTTAEENLKVAKAQDAIISGTATADDYKTVKLGEEVITSTNVAAFNAAAIANRDEEDEKAEQFAAAKTAIETAIAAQKLIDAKVIKVETAEPTKQELAAAILDLDKASTKNALLATLFAADLEDDDLDEYIEVTLPTLTSKGKVVVDLLASGTTKYSATVELELKASTAETALETALKATTFKLELAPDADLDDADKVITLVNALKAKITNESQKALITEDNIVVNTTAKTVTITLPTGNTVDVSYTITEA